MPSDTVDGNSPAFWRDGYLHVYTSTGSLLAMSGLNLENLSMQAPPAIRGAAHMPMWIEGVWTDDDGTLYAWYHHEPSGICGGKLTAPQIGALVSTDGGSSFEDLGIILSAGEAPNCGAQNGFFAGGHGDFSVILDQERQYFYFLFTNYGGAASSQGVVMARMAFEDRANPVGAVRKLYGSSWEEPGIGGKATPIAPAAVGWERSDADSLWGPAVHWNTSLNKYVVVLNRACCAPNWPQEGIYIMFSAVLDDPAAWSSPRKILDARQIGFAPGYYPQVFGMGSGETDTLAGEQARLFVKGISRWQLQFFAEEPPQDEDDCGGKCDPGNGLN